MEGAAEQHFGTFGPSNFDLSLWVLCIEYCGELTDGSCGEEESMAGSMYKCNVIALIPA